MHQSLGQESPLFHTAGQGFTQISALIRQVSPGESKVDVFFSFGCGLTVGVGEKIAKFLNPEVIINRWKVRHVAKHAPGFLRLMQDGGISKLDLAVGGLDQGGHRFNGRGFTGPVGSD